jgi:parallel beta-helix repeat protein
VTGNTATGDGGGILIEKGVTAQLTLVLIQGNNSTTGKGGGIAVESDSATQASTLNLNQVTVDDNSALDYYGGGIYIANCATVTITKSTISNNYSNSYGGGLYIRSSSIVNMTNDTVAKNSSGLDPGGGLYVGDPPGGGGIYDFGNVALTNVTVSDNSGGYAAGIDNFAGIVTLADTILARNTDEFNTEDDCGGSLTSQDYNVISAQFGCTFTGATTHNINPVYLYLGTLSNNGGPTQTIAPTIQSPVVDAGNDSTCASTDQRGVARPQGAHCDIGAVELDTTPMVVSSVRAGPNPTNAASVNFTVTFSEAVTHVDTSDFSLATTGISGASVAAVGGADTTYTVTANTGTGDGTLRLDVPASADITDLTNDPLVNLPYTGGDTYTIAKSTPTNSPTVTQTSTPTPLPTHTSTTTLTLTATKSATTSNTLTSTPTSTLTATSSRTVTATRTFTATSTPTRTATASKTITSTPTSNSTATRTLTTTPTATQTVTPPQNKIYLPIIVKGQFNAQAANWLDRFQSWIQRLLARAFNQSQPLQMDAQIR